LSFSRKTLRLGRLLHLGDIARTCLFLFVEAPLETLSEAFLETARLLNNIIENVGQCVF
jgi:hypothetical protein